jgi:2-keto-4-pentenoate hydratase
MTETGLPRAIRTAQVVAAATRLDTAATTVVPCLPVRDLIGATDIGLAYEVQQRLTALRLARGTRIIGRKIGLTSRAVQQQIGVDRPDFGVLFDDMLVPAGQPVPSRRLLQPKVEAEIAFFLSRDLDTDDIDADQVREAISYAVAALEIVDSRVKGWDIAITDTVADNASSGMFVLGTRGVAINEFEPKAVVMELSRDGVVVSSGDGTACLGDPLAAVAWLARTAREFGSPLRAGDVVLSGALGPMVDVTPGATVAAHLTELGRVAVTFTREEGE